MPAVLKCKAGALTGVPQLNFGIDSKMQAGHSDMQTRHSHVTIDVQECFVCIYKATDDLHTDLQATQCSNILLGDDAFTFETVSYTHLTLPTTPYV